MQRKVNPHGGKPLLFSVKTSFCNDEVDFYDNYMRWWTAYEDLRIEYSDIKYVGVSGGGRNLYIEFRGGGHRVLECGSKTQAIADLIAPYTYG